VSAASGRNDVDAHVRDRGAGDRFSLPRSTLVVRRELRDGPSPFNVIDPGQLIVASRAMQIGGSWGWVGKEFPRNTPRSTLDA